MKEAATGTNNNNKGKKAQTPCRVTSAGHTPHRSTSRSSTVVLQKSHTSPVEKSVMGVTLDVDKLKAIVKGYGEYPHKYRFVSECSIRVFQCLINYRITSSEWLHFMY